MLLEQRWELQTHHPLILFPQEPHDRSVLEDSNPEALKYLRKEDEYVDVMTPDLILLDLNLPKLNGREVL